MIEGGEDFRVQCLSCLDVQRLPLHFDTTEGKESREILCAPLHIETTEGKDSREILCALYKNKNKIRSSLSYRV